jgi:hypothetical protein
VAVLAVAEDIAEVYFKFSEPTVFCGSLLQLGKHEY